MGRDRVVETFLFGLAVLCFALTLDWSREAKDSFHIERTTPGALRIMTWNVGAAGGKRGSALADDLIPSIVSSIRRAQPDLCFLQEIASERQIVEIQQSLGFGWKALLSSGGSRRLAALSREGDLERIELTDLPQRSLVVLYTPPRGAAIFALGLHADAWSSSKRNAQIGRSIESFRSLEGGRPRLLLGDFNLDVDQRGDLFSDDAHLDVESYNFVTSQAWRDLGQQTGPTAEPDRRLDYLFLDAREFQVEQVGPWPNQRQGQMDHDPLMADITLP